MGCQFTKDEIRDVVNSINIENYFTKERIEKALKIYADKSDPSKIDQEGLTMAMLHLSTDFTIEFVYLTLLELFVNNANFSEESNQ